MGAPAGTLTIYYIVTHIRDKCNTLFTFFYHRYPFTAAVSLGRPASGVPSTMVS